MNRDDCLGQLTTREFGRPLVFFDETDSTNTQAMRAAVAGEAGHGAVFIAQKQTAGRGTDGNTWQSASGQGLWMSVILREAGPIRPAITLMPAIALARVLRTMYGVDAHLKWPNDVLVGPRKIAGILVESVPQAAGVIHVMGIGVNLNQTEFGAELKEIATSVREVIDRAVPVPVFFGQFMLEMEKLWNGPHDWPALWLPYSRMVNASVELKQGGMATQAVALGLTDEGFLRVREVSGIERVIMSRTGLDVRILFTDVV